MSFFFNDTATTEIYTLSLHDALPISIEQVFDHFEQVAPGRMNAEEYDAFVRDTVAFLSYVGEPAQIQRHSLGRSEEHTSELQSHLNIVCRLLLEKKNNSHNIMMINNN